MASRPVLCPGTVHDSSLRHNAPPTPAEPITVAELLEGCTEAVTARLAEARAERTVPVGERLSLSFESRRTLLAALCTIVSTEGVTDPDALQAECDVYNTLLPRGGVSACVTVVATPPGSARDALAELAGLDQHVWLVLGGKTRPAQFFGPFGLRQHVRFLLDADDVATLSDWDTPAFLRVDHARYACEAPLPRALRQSLVEDLQ
jgi:hypothetical protein